MLDINLDLNKHIQNFPPGLCNWNKTRMSIMYQKITIHQIRGYIINTARTIRHVAHDHRVEINLINLVAENFENVGDDTRIQHQSLRKL